MAIKETLKAPGGFFYLIRAARLILSDWRLLRLAALPFLINTLLFGGGIYAFVHYAWAWITVTYFQPADAAWYWEVAYWILGAALGVVAFGLIFFGFAAVGLIVAAPFNDLLSAAVERRVTGTVRERLMTLWELALFTMANEGRKMAVVVTIQGMLFVVGFIPGIGQVVFLIATPLFLGAVMAFEFTGYPLDRRGYRFADKRAYLRSHPGVAMGFGLSVAATLLLPIVNFLLLPLSVAGGTLLVLDHRPERTVDPGEGEPAPPPAPEQ